MRIVSLIPSATEIVCALGLADQLVGVTHECDYPAAVVGKPKVTRTHIPTDASSREIDRLVRSELSTRGALYSLDVDRLREVAPDLIITQSLCNVCAVADAEVQEAVCSLPGPSRVVRLEPTTLLDMFSNVHAVAQAAGVPARGDGLVERLRERIQVVQNRSAWLARDMRVVVLEWLDPLFSAGHWTPELVRLAGAIEPLSRPGDRSREITSAEVAAADPDALFIACCGFSVERTLQDIPGLMRDPIIAELRCVRDRRIFVVDGSAYFSRPGPRLVDSLEILAHALNPMRHLLPAGLPPAIQPA